MDIKRNPDLPNGDHSYSVTAGTAQTTITGAPAIAARNVFLTALGLIVDFLKDAVPGIDAPAPAAEEAKPADAPAAPVSAI